MVNPGKIEVASEIKSYILGGDASFTLVSVKSGTRYTFRVAKSDNNPNMFFVSLMTGEDNTNSYTYFGQINRGVFSFGRKSKLDQNLVSLKGFEWMWNNIKNNKVSSQVEFWTSGRCCHCHRTLTVPSSVNRHWGPICWQKHGFQAVAA